MRVCDLAIDFHHGNMPNTRTRKTLAWLRTGHGTKLSRLVQQGNLALALVDTLSAGGFVGLPGAK
jgi:hypothetical protein